jgi:hypothetical protein
MQAWIPVTQVEDANINNFVAWRFPRRRTKCSWKQRTPFTPDLGHNACGAFDLRCHGSATMQSYTTTMPPSCAASTPTTTQQKSENNKYDLSNTRPDSKAEICLKQLSARVWHFFWQGLRTLMLRTVHYCRYLLYKLPEKMHSSKCTFNRPVVGTTPTSR